jgi:hypothetical protein
MSWHRLLLAVHVLIFCDTTVALTENQSTKFTRFDYHLLPPWCETVLVTHDRKAAAEIGLGDVFRVENPGSARFGYRCKAPGDGGTNFVCEDSSLLLIVYGLNIEGAKERKITVLCVR